MGNEDNENCRTPLHQAAQLGQLDIVKAISKVLEDKNPGDGHNVTPFHLASYKGHLPVVQYLRQYVPDINIRTDDHWNNRTPLHWGPENGNLATVKYLIESGADPNLKSSTGQTAYDYAVSNEKNDTAQYLKQF